jgi:hypothetical protein
VLKHIKPKDILEFLLYGLAFVALIVVCGLENAPLGILLPVLVIVALPLWIGWFVLVAYERKKRAGQPRLKMMHNGEWLDVVEVEYVPQRRDIPIYDQFNDPQDPGYIDYTKENH